MPTKLQAWDQVRLPLVGSTAARIIDLTGLSAAGSGIVGVGIVGLSIVGQTVSTTKDQHYINAIPIVVDNPLTGKQTFYVVKRPGWAVLNTPAAGAIGTAVRVWAGQGQGTKVITAFGDTNSTVYDGTNSLGSTTGVVNHIDETQIGTVPNLTFVTGGNTAYFYPEGGSLTLITSVNFPGNIAGQTITGRMIFLDGFAFILTKEGRLYNADNGSLANWSANSYLSCQMKPDAGVGLARYKNQVVAFGTESIEFFNNVGNPTGSPLQRTEQGFMNIGCINEHAYKEIDDTVVWIGATSESKIAIYMLDGLQAKRISNATIEAILASVNPAQLYLNAQTLYGKTFVFVVSNSDAQTYVYSVETGIWSEMSGSAILWHHLAGIGKGVRYVYALSRNSTAGDVYYINPTNYVFADKGQAYTVTIQTSKFDGETLDRKFFDQIRVIGDTYDTTNNITVLWTDDDYQTFSSGRVLNLGGNDTRLMGCGQARRRAFKIVQSNQQPLRLEALEFRLRQGIN